MKKASTVILIILLPLLLYPLSSGPMFRLCSDPSGRLGGIKGELFLRAYAPILWQYQNGPPAVREVVRGYFQLFRDHP
jgi:hypothetical protein